MPFQSVQAQRTRENPCSAHTGVRSRREHHRVCGRHAGHTRRTRKHPAGAAAVCGNAMKKALI